MNDTYCLLAYILALPLMGSVAAFIAGRFNKNISGWIATGASAAAFGVSCKSFSALGDGKALYCKLFDWIQVANLSIAFDLRFDRLSAVMCLIVTGVGTLIHLYSVSYMHEDEGRHRFFAYLNLFMFSMLTLVLGGNLPVLFIGWEGVGLCSYLLIGFWFKNISYAAAGRKAFVVNRIGDAGVLFAMFLLFWQFGTFDFYQLRDLVTTSVLDGNFYTLVAFGLFLGATGKSAQIPLFVWLPDAMAGPTPVSALIHAATMVTAGVYMMARLYFIFELAPHVTAIICVIALLTAFIAATTALTQFDIKKVLAYSTVSQLGFMFLAAASGAYWVAIFHVMTHAFFKACLFLGAGSVIHGCHHEQDMRHMGGLMKLMPLTAITYLISVLAIAGIAPLSGYYSKHAILAALEHNNNYFLHPYIGWIVIVANITAFLTAFYMTRSFAMTFLGEYRGHAHPHESNWKMVLPLIILAALAVIGGIFPGHHLAEYLSAVMPVEEGHHAEGILDSIIHSWIGILGVFLGLLFYTKLSTVPQKIYAVFTPLGKLFSAKWYFDEIYGALITRPLEAAAKLLWKDVDQSLIDGAVNGTAAFVDINGEIVRTLQTGQIRHYAFYMFLSTVLVILFYMVL
jgi:NADH-quinone oxidoreductase subunit L